MHVAISFHYNIVYNMFGIQCYQKNYDNKIDLSKKFCAN